MRSRPVTEVVAVLAIALLLPLVACANEGEDPLGLSSSSTSSSSTSTTQAPVAETTTAPTTTTTVTLPEPVPVTWADCGGGLQCGSVTVPVSYQDPTGPSLELAVVKNPADVPDQRIGTLVMNPGGPGASGVRRVARGFQITPEVGNRFDMVGFDPRGIGQSTPITCGDAVPAFRAADLGPDTPEEAVALEAAARAVADECAASEGDRLGHYGSVEVAHDIEVIRRAVGEEQISFVGLSYGTLLGQLWAEWYPASVRALVLDGVVSPAGAGGAGGSTAQAGGVEASFAAIDAACTAAPSCPLAETGGLAPGYDELARRIEDGTVRGRGVGPTQLAYAAFWATYDKDNWPRLWAAVASGLDGDLAGIADLAGSFTELVTYAPFAIVSCLDGSHPEGYDEWHEGSEAVLTASPRFGQILSNELLPCAFWPESTLEPVSVDAAGAPPILVVGSTGDAATTYETAESVARQLDSGVLLTVDLDGHVAIGDSDCADAAITRYLVDLTLPEVGDALLTRSQRRGTPTVASVPTEPMGGSPAMEFNLADLHDAVCDAIGDRECIVWRDRRLTYSEVADRTNRLANHLIAAGLGATAERGGLDGHETGQDHLACYLHNGNEYIESMLGAYKARVAPFNVNYRYVAEELRYLLNDAGARAIVFHSAFAERLAEVLPDLPALTVRMQVDDGTGADLLPGAQWYEEALAAASPDRPDIHRSPDDLYILYTGGTTGMPKGVLWRQADIYVGALGGRNLGTGGEFESEEQVVEAARNGGARILPAPPFMHGAGHWLAFNAMNSGSTICIQDDTVALDSDDIWRTIEREKVNILLIVGDAFARPLVDQLEMQTASGKSYDLSSMLMVISGGAPLNSTLKDRFLAQLPSVMVMDAVGASETGSQMSHLSAAGQAASTGTFTPGPGAAIVSSDLTAALEAGHDEVGWLAQKGRVPLGYLGDADKTARTFPVIDGTRYSVPGDRARLTADGVIELYGRDSVTISSGGEKIFAEEVEQAIAHHPDVYDVVCAGRPSERWGQEVVAVVQLRDGSSATEEDLLAEAASHVARYKLPKAFRFRDAIVRSPAGKADYRWAKEQAAQDA